MRQYTVQLDQTGKGLLEDLKRIFPQKSRGEITTMSYRLAHETFMPKNTLIGRISDRKSKKIVN